MAFEGTFVFEVFRDGEKIDEIRTSRDRIKIGRHERSHVVLDDDSVSRLHAAIEATESQIVLIDLGSGRGTFVNGDRVNKAYLSHGDRIRIGVLELKFGAYADRASAEAAASRAQGGAAAQRVAAVPDEIIYSQRYLSKPAATDGSLEVAMLVNDFVAVDRLYKPPRDLTIGGGEGADLPILDEMFGDESFLLVDSSSGQPVLRVHAKMRGELYIGSERYALERAVEEGVARKSGDVALIPIGDDVRVRINVGNHAIFLHRSQASTVAVSQGLESVYQMLGYILISGLIHAAFLLLILSMAPTSDDFGNARLLARDRSAEIGVDDPIEEEEEPEEPEVAENADEDADGTANNQQQNENQNNENTEQVYEAELSQEQASEVAANTGVNQALNQMFDASSGFGAAGGDTLDSIQFRDTGSGSASLNIGPSGLDRYGSGVAGAQSGGGAFGGPVGSGPLATGGIRNSGRVGAAVQGLSENRPRQVAVIPGAANVTGGLDREIIRRVVNQHRREISNCYQSQLQSNPNLGGRIVISFVVDPSGAVAQSSIGSSTMGSPAVEQCIVQRVRRWRFPPPDNGGIVRVNYPYTFTPG